VVTALCMSSVLPPGHWLQAKNMRTGPLSARTNRATLPRTAKGLLASTVHERPFGEVALRRKPSWTLNTMRQRRANARCIVRDPKQRLRDIGEARIEFSRIEARAAMERGRCGRPASSSYRARAARSTCIRT
jgi:hypothetical protein